MEAAADGEGEESSAFRCADAARYAVASVVTILIVVVVVKAVMVLRPIPLYLAVPGGSVFVTRSESQHEEVLFHFSLRAQNPSDRVQMYYTGVKGYIFSNNMSASSASSESDYGSMFYFNVPDIPLPQQNMATVDEILELMRETTRSPYFFDWLYEATSGSGIVTDLTLRLDGTLITRPMPGGSNTTGRRTSFYCRPLLVLAGRNMDVAASLNKQDAFCVSGGTPRRLTRSKA